MCVVQVWAACSSPWVHLVLCFGVCSVRREGKGRESPGYSAITSECGLVLGSVIVVWA